MLFNSITFAFFFPLVTLLYFWLPRCLRNAWLLAASCVFYAAFVPAYLLILAFTIVVDYFAGIAMENSQGSRRRAWLIASLVANIGVLAVFKYAGFFVANSEALLHWLGSERSLGAWDFILPIGLSFHTFQAMSYTIEVYRGKQRAERSFLIYALYVMFYPQLVAGPIERPQNLLPQFHAHPEPSEEDFSVGFRWMLWGFFKKLFIADRLAVAVNHFYDNPGGVHGLAAWVGIYFFALQIYCDFSAYSDIARGTARVMGFRLMQNFDRPYFSASLPEFWRRWHISLSTWFRDYLFLPLGGSRVSPVRRSVNLLLVFLLSGFWHGASWTFVAWGGLHGLAMVLIPFLPQWRLPKWASTILTFNFVAFALIFFRAPSFAIALQVMRSLFRWQSSLAALGLSSFELSVSFGGVAILLLVEWLQPRLDISRSPTWVRWISYYATAASIGLLGKLTDQPFIYFQF